MDGVTSASRSGSIATNSDHIIENEFMNHDELSICEESIIMVVFLPTRVKDECGNCWNKTEVTN